METKSLAHMAEDHNEPRSTKKSKSRKDRSRGITPKTPLVDGNDVQYDRSKSEPHLKTVPQPVSLSARWSLFCPYLSAKNTLLFFLSVIGLFVAIQGTLAIVVGPHYVGLAIAFLLAICLFIALGRTASSVCRIPTNTFFRVLWFITTILLFGLCLFFLVIYVLTYANAPLYLGFPDDCSEHPHACVRVMYNKTDNWDAGNMTVPILKQTPEKIIELLEEWIKTQKYEISVLEGIDDRDGFLHARFVTTFFGFIDDFYLQVIKTGVEGYYAVQIQSESRLSIGDLGQNKGRVQYFLSHFKKRDD